MNFLRVFSRKLALTVLSFNAKHKYLKDSKTGVQIILSHSTNDEVIKNLLRFVDSVPIKYFSSMSQILKKKAGNEEQYSLILTFDDGFKNNLKIGKILSQRKIRACFYINPLVVQKSGNDAFCKDHASYKLNSKYSEFLNWDDVLELQSLGHDIGCHTYSHINLGKSQGSICEHEILKSKEFLLKHKVNTNFFAYPYGREIDFNKNALQIVVNSGYKFISTGIRGINRINDINDIKYPIVLFRDNFDFNENSRFLYYFLIKANKNKINPNSLFQY